MRHLDGDDSPEVLERLNVLVQQFQEQDEKSFSKWLRKTLLETLSQTLLHACTNNPDHQSSHDTLIADLDFSEDEEKDGRVWISETTMGGAGAVQAFAEAFSREPRKFFRAIETALAPTEMELSSRDLNYFVSLACEDESIKDCVKRLRTEDSHTRRQEAQKELYKELLNKGLNGSGYLKVSINTRFLKPGMSIEGDELIRDLLKAWDELEKKFEIEIGLNEFCFIALALPGIRVRERINNLIDSDEDNDSRLIHILSSLLWPKGLEVRQYAFESYHPYREQKTVDPMLVRSLILNREIQQVDLSVNRWNEKLKEYLQNFGTVQLISKKSENKALRKALMEIISTPVDVEFLLFMPIIERTERSDSDIKVTITLRETV
jgi:hypothetical protein